MPYLAFFIPFSIQLPKPILYNATLIVLLLVNACQPNSLPGPMEFLSATLKSP